MVRRASLLYHSKPNDHRSTTLMFPENVSTKDTKEVWYGKFDIFGDTIILSTQECFKGTTVKTLEEAVH